MIGSKLDAHNIDDICRRIESGETYREIARDLGCSSSTLTDWLHRADNAERSARARELSAEGLLDRGLQTLIDANADSPAALNAEISRARAIAQELARRAAIRNPKYSEKHNVMLSGDKENPIQSNVTIDASDLSEEQLRVLASIGIKDK